MVCCHSTFSSLFVLQKIDGGGGGEAVQNREVLRTFFDASKYPLQMGIEYEISQSNQGQYVPLAFALQFEVRCFQSTLTFCSCFQIKL
jgi:hypothetical protein